MRIHPVNAQKERAQASKGDKQGSKFHPLIGETTSSRMWRSPIPSSVVRICTALSTPRTCKGAKCLTCKNSSTLT